MNSLLIVDDDKPFCAALEHAFTDRGFEVRVAHNATDALTTARLFEPEWALVDLKMPGPSGLELIPQLLAVDPATRIVVLTGYAAIGTAVEAIKLGAVHYLAKPVEMEEILAAFHRQEGNPQVPVEAEARTLMAAGREHILATLKRHHGNISAAARELGLHRRSLQRKLDKIK